MKKGTKIVLLTGALGALWFLGLPWKGFLGFNWGGP